MNIYLDYNSTTPVDPRVLETMLPYFTEKFGNAASKTHVPGWIAEAAVEKAREQTAQLINAAPNEIIFTSGATEAINTALKGIFESCKHKGNHIVTISTEHKAVLDTCRFLETKGAKITCLPVDHEGQVDLNQLNQSITDKTILICAMYANNETGIILPVNKIAKTAQEKNILFFCDATQAAGKIQVDVQSDGMDLLCLSGHKFYAPKGIGALYIKRKKEKITLPPLLHGGGHEMGIRSGTLNVPGIVGLGAACQIAGKEIWEDAGKTSTLRTLLEQRLTERKNTFINGSIKNRLPNTTNICFAGIKADSLIAKLPNIALATGSACTSAIPDPSHVLKAMGLTNEMAFSSVRFSLGRFTTEEEIKTAIEKISFCISK